MLAAERQAAGLPPLAPPLCPGAGIPTSGPDPETLADGFGRPLILVIFCRRCPKPGRAPFDQFQGHPLADRPLRSIRWRCSACMCLASEVRVYWERPNGDRAQLLIMGWKGS